MNAFVIHHSANTEREPFVADLELRVPGLRRVEAIVRPDAPVEGSTRSHLSIIERAKADHLPSVWIMEDDCILTPAFNVETWLYTLDRADPARQSPGLETDGFAIVVGGAAGWRAPYDACLPRDAHLVGVERWSSCHCWVVFQQAYDALLQCDPRMAIDVSAANLQVRKAVRVPFVAVRPRNCSSPERRIADDGPWFQRAEAGLLSVLEGNTPAVTFRRSPEVDEEAFEDDLLLFQRENRSVIALNKAAASLWDALRWPQTPRDLASLLVEAGIRASQAEQIVASTLDGLIAHRFAIPVSADPDRSPAPASPGSDR